MAHFLEISGIILIRLVNTSLLCSSGFQGRRVSLKYYSKFQTSGFEISEGDSISTISRWKHGISPIELLISLVTIAPYSYHSLALASSLRSSGKGC